MPVLKQPSLLARAPIFDTSIDLNALFVAQARSTPDAIALQDEAGTVSYATLDITVENLSKCLRGHGVGRDDLVGVLLGRGNDYVIACLAALRAGGAFLVLELAYPPDLLVDVIADAKPAVIITHTKHASRIKLGVPTIVYDQPDSHEVRVPKTPGTFPAKDDLKRLAFVSYSSGTTGKPKGIANPHSAPIRSYELRFRLSDLGPGDRVACNVFFVWEMLRPLLRGATVICVPDESSYDPAALVQLLATQNITETLMTPTLLAAILSQESQVGEKLPNLKTLWLNGEVVTTELARRAINAFPQTRLLNCYSACETHEIACGDVRDVYDEQETYCPVGPPMDPEHIYILDNENRRMETGKLGELFVGGDLLARGYLNLPDTTAAAFLPDAFDPRPDARMYRTGDIARMTETGYLEITGRVGAMIKVRGYSVVPAKIESTICEQLAVKQCAVLAHGDGLDRQLVAYIVPDKQARLRPNVSISASGHSPGARRVLSNSLAQYMIPALWVELAQIPTDKVSGKASLKSLPAPPMSRPQTPLPITPLTSNEQVNMTVDVQTIVALWAAALNIPCSIITPDHSFFDLGGHSLTLANLATRLSQHYGFPIPVAPLVVNPTLSGHTQVVESARDGHTSVIDTNLATILRVDSMLPKHISFPTARLCTLSSAETIFLTGATGFLGAFLLADLISSTTATIICLVRFKSPSKQDHPSGIARIRRNLLDLGLWQDSMLDRMVVIPGNLSQPQLGLTSEMYTEISARVDVIIHAGATVNLVYPYAALQAPNVIGTTEILKLASQKGATLQYISTNGVLPPSDEGWTEDVSIDAEAAATQLTDGYGQSKWVAEQLVFTAGRRGLPVRIMRLGTISGHSVTGATNAWDLLNAIIVESLQIGVAPDIPGWRSEMAPVDFISGAILRIAELGETCAQQIFHLGDPAPVHTSSIFQDLSELDYPTKRLAWAEWVALWTEQRGSAQSGEGNFTADILRGGMPSVGFLKEIIVLKDEATTAAVGDLPRPSVDSRLLEVYARNWSARGWLPKPPRRTVATTPKVTPSRGPLTGKIAVITGASSGIGAAVALALAREGAHIALAARRLDALEALQASITSSTHGVRVLVHQTDVTQQDSVKSLMQTTADTLGPIDILVSCAGVMYYTLMANVETTQWEQTVDVNCKGLLHCLSTTIPSMLSRNTGHIVAISSDAGRKVFPGLGVYSASKFFVEATLQALRVETAGSGLRVTSVQPGNVDTGLLGMSTDAEALKRYGEPSGAKVLDAEDVARAIVYALSQPAHVAVNEVLIEPRDEPI